MDVDEIILTTLLYLDEIGKLKKWSEKANKKLLENIIISPEGELAPLLGQIVDRSLVMSVFLLKGGGVGW